MRRPRLLAWAVLLGLTSAAGVARAECGDLLIVLDRSSSMYKCKIGGKTKEEMAKDALKSIAAAYPGMPMGLMVFPDTKPDCEKRGLAEACLPAGIKVEVAADGTKKVTDYLATAPRSCGGTPTSSAMLMAKDYKGWSGSRAHFVLLITDGQPTCDDGEEGGTPNEATKMCEPAAMCDGKGACECKKPTKVFDSIADLASHGIKTFVVGFEGTADDGGTCAPPGSAGPFNPDTLNTMADMGGVPQSGGTHYYSATNESSLRSALEAILGKVAGGTIGGCQSGGPGGSGAGSGGSGASGGEGGGGDQSGTGGEGGSTGHKGTGNAGCACRLDDARPSPTRGTLALALLLGLAAARRRRRR